MYLTSYPQVFFIFFYNKILFKTYFILLISEGAKFKRIY
jgi:hypothetical protein